MKPHPPFVVAALIATILLCLATVRPAIAETISASSEATEVGWKTQRIADEFFAEGSAAGDFNGDGIIDIVYGPVWYAGPDFVTRHNLAAPNVVPISTYSEHFFSHVIDANGDGRDDVISIGFPGKTATLFLQPAFVQPAEKETAKAGDSSNQFWAAHSIAPRVSNESPAFVDLIPGGMPELVCARDRSYGFYSADNLDDATQPWRWVAISEPGSAIEPFGHGLGVGDVDGDGRMDIIDRQFWWRHPETNSNESANAVWQRNRWIDQPFGGGGSQIHVHDFDGDGDNDLLTVQNAHAHGLAWFEQVAPGQFTRHDISGEASTQNPHGYAVSQMHAVETADVDGDGRIDFVTGKRFMAHQGKDPGGLQAPVVVWFRNVESDEPGGIEFIPHVIDDQSGVGVDVLVTDINGDGRIDVVSASKHGLDVHYQTDAPENPVHVAERWRTPKLSAEEYANGWSPAEAAQNMIVPPGFAVDLIAAEPDLVQPIAMCFDDRGRIWVIEGHTYPTKAPEGEGKDRILILEDADGDGSFETRKVFAEKLNLASGIAVGFGGVWVGAAPDLLFYPDADRDDVPDESPRVLLDGWGYQDTHETLNSFTWGMDGWLYGCHGVFTHSNVGAPGTPNDQRTPINAGVWRYHPVTQRFEVFAHGTSNPWGVDFNEDGDWFVSACVIPHLYHLTHGGRYFRQAGQHFNEHTYDDIKTIADHLHYGDGTFASANSRQSVDRELVNRTATTTSMVGGGHAHCGLTIYQADEFPAHYRGELFFHNLHGHRIVRDHVEREGSGYIGRHRPDFAMSGDHQQIGVGMMQGPDGALYTSDWHDDQTCHHRDHEIWDRTDGRIFRIRYGDAKPYQFDLQTLSDAELLANLTHPNAFFVRRSQRILHERHQRGELQRDLVAEHLKELLHSDVPRRHRLQAIWTAWTCGLIAPAGQSQTQGFDLIELLSDRDEVIRGWAVNLMAESRDSGGQPNVVADEIAALTKLAASERSSVTRRSLASALQRLPMESRLGIAEGLLSYTIDQRDRNLEWLIWYGIEPVVETNPDDVMALVGRSSWDTLKRFVARRTTTTPTGRETLVRSIGDQARSQEKLDGRLDWMLDELLQSARSRGGVAMPPSWPVASKTLRERATQPTTRDRVDALSIQFGDESALPQLRVILADSSAQASARLDALRWLTQAKDEGLGELLLKLVDDRDVGSQAIRGLSRFDSPQIASTLVERFADWSPSKQSDALATLTSRPASAITLISAMESGAIDPTVIPAYAIRNIVGLAFNADKEAVVSRLENVWGRIGSTNDTAEADRLKYQKMLTSKAIASADRAAGKALYEVNCGKCHKLFGEGEMIGPDLTGANRTDVNYWLENILQPNAVIGKAYQMTSFLMDDGRLVAGLVQSRNEDAVTVQTATEVTVLPTDEIESEKESEVSLMPEGQLQPMTPKQVKDLFGYLMSPGPTYQREWAIEAESLAATAQVNGGRVMSQNMKSFNDQWSADQQLWWTGGGVGSTMTLNVPQSVDGPAEITLHFTGAHDYGAVDVSINGTSTQTVDGYSKEVRVIEPAVWDRVDLKAGEPIRIELKITGKNAKATPAFMVGIDSVSVRPVSR